MPAHPGEWVSTAEAADMLCVSLGRLHHLSPELLDPAIERRAKGSTFREGFWWSRADIERVLHVRQAARIGLTPSLKVAASIRNGLLRIKNDSREITERE